MVRQLNYGGTLLYSGLTLLLLMVYFNRHYSESRVSTGLYTWPGVGRNTTRRRVAAGAPATLAWLETLKRIDCETTIPYASIHPSTLKYVDSPTIRPHAQSWATSSEQMAGFPYLFDTTPARRRRILEYRYRTPWRLLPASLATSPQRRNRSRNRRSDSVSLQ